MNLTPGSMLPDDQPGVRACDYDMGGNAYQGSNRCHCGREAEHWLLDERARETCQLCKVLAQAFHQRIARVKENF